MMAGCDEHEQLSIFNNKTPEEWFSDNFERKIAEYERDRATSLSIMCTKGTLDWAYTTFIIGSTAAALGWNVSMFFTFYGLNLLKKDISPAISGLGNPAMPMKMPYGPEWLRSIDMNIPNIVQANIPGFENLATGLMKETLRQKGVAPVLELREACADMGCEMLACQMTVDLFGYSKDDFFDGVNEWAGAATYLDKASKAGVTIFI